MKILSNQKGMLLTLTMVYGAVGIIILSGIVSWGLLNMKAAKQTAQSEMAIQIAESGIEYYRWHLAHAPVDYYDGTATSGPYLHQFEDKDGNNIGKFTLDITPPPSGSTLVTVKSSGENGPNFKGKRTIIVRLAKPSLAKFAVAANDNMRFGAGTEVFGPIHSNLGVHFDGIAHNLVTSALGTYSDPDDGGPNVFGVHTDVNPVDPLPPAAVPSRPDVFIAGRQFPVPAVDFTGLTADLSQIKSDAQANGFYRAGSGAMGYHLTLKVNDTFDLYKVNSLQNAPNNCTNDLAQAGWGTWSVNSQTLLGNYPFPSNGLIFLEDNVFVDGQINTARVTIAAATFPDNPAQRKSITVNNDLLYTNYDGQDVISLIAQNNINVGLYSDDDLRIDAALVAQNGRAGRYYYDNYCSANYIRQTLTLYGIIATSQRYGFAYTDNTGYLNRNIIYDTNLLYAPPPSFPQTSDQYTTLSWQESD